MTKQELIDRYGDVNADMAIDLLLKDIPFEQLKTAVTEEAARVDKQIKELIDAGYIYNDPYWGLCVYWKKPDDIFDFYMEESPDNAKKEYDEAYKKCRDADALFYRKHKLEKLMKDQND